MKILSCVAMVAVMGNASAAGIPTIDTSNIVQTTVTAFETLEQGRKQLTEIQNQVNQFTRMGEQLRQQQVQFQSITGNYNMGQLLNSQEYRQAKRFVPKNWQETLGMLEGAQAQQNQAKAQQAARSARQAGERFTAQSIYTNTSSKDAIQYANEAKSIFTQLGLGKTNYNQTETRLKNIETLTDEIDTAEDLKAAADLNNRLLTEQSTLTAEMMRLQSAAHINQIEQRLSQHNRRAADVAMANGTLPRIPDIQ